MDFKLLSKDDAVRILAEIANDGAPLVVEVSEDICFKDDDCAWVTLGEIVLEEIVADHQEVADSEADKRNLAFQMAIRLGAYEWHVPSKEQLNEYIEKAVSEGIQSEENRVKRVQKSFHEGLQNIVRRLSLLLPTFDPDALCKMPLRFPTTVVADTSAVHQGGLNGDFAQRGRC